MGAEMVRETFGADGLDVPYRQLSLVDLIHRVVDHSDHLALREFHEHRYVFRCGSHQPLRLADYLGELRDSPRVWQYSGRDSNVLAAAYDLTLDKFRRLPAETAICIPGTRGPRRDGPDCRSYFRAFLAHLDKMKHDAPSQVYLELVSARRLEVFALRHFLLSCLECRRRSKVFLRRYCWRLDGNAVCLWMPSYLSPAKCRAWLESHVDQPDLSRPDERERIQHIVDDHLHTPRLIRFSEPGGNDGRFPAKHSDVAPSVLQDLSVRGLAEAVAREKADNIDQQRPTIRRLGRARLEQLILAIFEGLASSDYCAESVARTLGLSNAALSRFAGSHWRRPGRNRETAGIPDLWRNTAQVLGHSAEFAEAAKAAGAWTTAAPVLEDRIPPRPAEKLPTVADTASDDHRPAQAGETKRPAGPLFFIPLIARAMRGPDVTAALIGAFTAIREWGRQEGNPLGLIQFRRFMEWVAQSAVPADPTPDELHAVLELAWESATGEPCEDVKARQAALYLTSSRPALQHLVEELSTWLSPSVGAGETLKLVLDRNGLRVGTITLTPEGGTLTGISPGEYWLSLATGRRVWEGKLTPNELKWSLAFPGQPLAMAAATEDVRTEATRTEELLDGELILQVFPGIATGRIMVIRSTSGGR